MMVQLCCNFNPAVRHVRQLPSEDSVSPGSGCPLGLKPNESWTCSICLAGRGPRTSSADTAGTIGYGEFKFAFALVSGFGVELVCQLNGGSVLVLVVKMLIGIKS